MINVIPPPLCAPHRVDVLVAGLGPGGCAAAISAHRHGLSTLGVEMRGPEGSRARLVLVRPGALAALESLGLSGFTGGRRTTTIARTEERLRAVLARAAMPGSADSGMPQLALRWHTRVVELRVEPNVVQVTLEDADGQLHAVTAGHVIDATGGRLESLGLPTRRTYGPRHLVVTTEFETEPWFDGIAGARDVASREVLILVPMLGRQSVTAYLDLPPGEGGDAATAVRRFEAIARRLDLVRPRQEPLAVDVVQRLLQVPARGRVLPIGDSVGTVDLWLGAGMSTAIEDAVEAGLAVATSKTAATADAADAAIVAAQRRIYARHRRRCRQGRLMQAVRPIIMNVWPSWSLAAINREVVRSPPGLWQAMRLVAGRRPVGAATPP